MFLYVHPCVCSLNVNAKRVCNCSILYQRVCFSKARIHCTGQKENPMSVVDVGNSCVVEKRLNKTSILWFAFLWADTHINRSGCGTCDAELVRPDVAGMWIRLLRHSSVLLNYDFAMRSKTGNRNPFHRLTFLIVHFELQTWQTVLP